jgi:hypothetical protein
MIVQKQPDSVEYFDYLVSMITNDQTCTRKIKSRIEMAKAAFKKEEEKEMEKENLFTSKLDLNLRKKLLKC